MTGGMKMVLAVLSCRKVWWRPRALAIASPYPQATLLQATRTVCETLPFIPSTTPGSASARANLRHFRYVTNPRRTTTYPGAVFIFATIDPSSCLKGLFWLVDIFLQDTGQPGDCASLHDVTPGAKQGKQGQAAGRRNGWASRGQEATKQRNECEIRGGLRLSATGPR
jgi:hypothetical protein